jgi:hypothetical protein
MSQSHQVLVLSKELSGESFLKLHLLGPELGYRLCLKRVASKNRSLTSTPDLFDTADVQIESSRQGTALFVGEYQITRRRSEIGLNYRALRYASDLSNLLIYNGGHMADLPALHQLAERSMDAFAARLEPAVVFLKSIYLLLKDEGYPVREFWWPQVPTQLREVTRTLLSEPSPEALTPEDRAACEASVQNLLHWLRRETDLSLPEGIL